MKTLPKYSFNLLGFIVLFLGAMVSLAIFSLPVLFYSYFTENNYIHSEWYMIICYLAPWLGAIAAFDFIICRPQTQKPLQFNFSINHGLTYFFIFPMFFGMLLISEFTISLLPIDGPIFGELYKIYTEFLAMLKGNISLMVLLAVIFAPIFEEIVFRGIIQKGMINKGMNPNSAIWISAFLFGLIHANPWQFVGALLLGFVLGTVYHKSQSLILPILLHAFNNVLSIISLHYLKSESFAELFQIPKYYVLGIGILLFSLSYYLFIKKYHMKI